MGGFCFGFHPSLCLLFLLALLFHIVHLLSDLFLRLWRFAHPRLQENLRQFLSSQTLLSECLLNHQSCETHRLVRRPPSDIRFGNILFLQIVKNGFRPNAVVILQMVYDLGFGNAIVCAVFGLDSLVSMFGSHCAQLLRSENRTKRYFLGFSECVFVKPGLSVFKYGGVSKSEESSTEKGNPQPCRERSPNKNRR
ncbi:uncharacterized protein EV422DRAFT_276933 [Fimicolochytrium jonesii]|uniref:uncharacterized protein n=1 Tax=Fimicolochytrium jonesii TaxID=1396493 RepID=UPI0022FF2710|nr:uncharacterized protein EV422DRAFT_276933 [Fimicolochytrium jonesii]KAI8816737.1 hypothetical protein EV422DRAFT_276933 [Fimicolochytrium jonesii]